MNGLGNRHQLDPASACVLARSRALRPRRRSGSAAARSASAKAEPRPEPAPAVAAKTPRRRDRRPAKPTAAPARDRPRLWPPKRPGSRAPRPPSRSMRTRELARGLRPEGRERDRSEPRTPGGSLRLLDRERPHDRRPAERDPRPLRRVARRAREPAAPAQRHALRRARRAPSEDPPRLLARPARGLRADPRPNTTASSRRRSSPSGRSRGPGPQGRSRRLDLVAVDAALRGADLAAAPVQPRRRSRLALGRHADHGAEAASSAAPRRAPGTWSGGRRRRVGGGPRFRPGRPSRRGAGSPSAGRRRPRRCRRRC